MLVVNQLAGFMAPASGPLEYVGGNTGQAAVSTDVTVDLTALTGGVDSAAGAGDIVVVVSALQNNADQNMVVNTSGYTELVDIYADDTRDTNMGVHYKIMGSSPDSSVTVDNPGGWLAVVVQVWRNVNQSTPIDVTTTTATGTNSAVANPPSITPATPGAVILACGAGAFELLRRFTTNSLDNFVEEVGSDSNLDVDADCAVAISSYSDWTSGAYDPAAFGLSGADSIQNSWAAATVALRPG